MVYRGRDELTVLELQTYEENISVDKLKDVIIAKPSNTIYCEQDGKLYGMITMGDIQRACDSHKNIVAVNMNFTSLKIGEHRKAERIFCEKTRINALPVLDLNACLKGDWLRWDNPRYNKHMFRGGG